MNNKDVDSLAFILAIMATQVISIVITQLSPLVIGSLMVGMELNEQQAGLFVFAEFSVLAITSLVIAPFLPKFSFRSLCWFAVGISIPAQIYSIFTPNVTLAMTLRCIAGFGEGIIYAVSLAAVATYSKNPDKLYSQIQIMWALLSIVLFSVGGYLSEQYAHRGIFTMIVVLTVPLIFLLRGLTNKSIAVDASKTDSDDYCASNFLGGMLLLAIFSYMIASAGLYIFSEPLGKRAGFNTAEISYFLTIGTALGFSGAWFASWLNIRHGRVLPMTGFIAAFAITVIIMCINRNPYVYGVFICFSIITFYFSIPYLFGLAAALDNKGRWAAAAGSAYLFGFAAAPALSGSLIEWIGYTGLGYVSAIIAGIAWLLFMYVIKSVEQPESEMAVNLAK